MTFKKHEFKNTLSLIPGSYIGLIDHRTDGTDDYAFFQWVDGEHVSKPSYSKIHFGLYIRPYFKSRNIKIYLDELYHCNWES